MANDLLVRDLDLVSMLQSGDESAFALLCDNYAALLFGTIIRIVNEKKQKIFYRIASLKFGKILVNTTLKKAAWLPG